MLLLPLIVGGCATSPPPEPAPAPGPAPLAGPVLPDPAPATDSDFEPTAVDLAEQFLADGELEEAARLFGSTLAEGEHGEERRRALWGLALVRLTPGTSLHDLDEAATLLREIGEGGSSDPGPLHLQAQGMLQLVEELRRTRTLLGEQQALVDELSAVVEQLKLIDLNRRPGL